MVVALTDVIERALYNGINSGMSLDGTLYCYRNPLAFDPSTGDKIRNPWYDVTCCPPNLERTFASLPGYLYSTSSDGIYVHLYDNSELDWHLEDGTPLQITQTTSYPWEGEVHISVSPARASDFTLYLRIPGWTEGAQVAVNGKSISGASPGQYLAIRRRWQSGDAIRLQMDMRPQVLQANPHIADDTGRVAVQRGPLVYCMEELDQPKGIALADVSLDLDTRTGKAFQHEYKADLLDGVVVLHHRGSAFEASSAEMALYAPANLTHPKTRPQEVTLIPYYVWANRQPCAMQVWVPYMRT